MRRNYATARTEQEKLICCKGRARKTTRGFGTYSLSGDRKEENEGSGKSHKGDTDGLLQNDVPKSGRAQEKKLSATGEKMEKSVGRKVG
jgi:hypothetical protein